MKSMKKSFALTILAVAAIIFTFSESKAQYNPYDDGRKIATVGLGFSGYGIPVFGRFEVPVVDNITVGAGVSYRSFGETFLGDDFNTSVIGISGLGNYHFNELLEINDSWDLYAGASLGFYIWNYNYDYSGSRTSGLGFDVQIGGRYFFSDNIAANLEFGGGNYLAGGTIGVSFLF